MHRTRPTARAVGAATALAVGMTLTGCGPDAPAAPSGSSSAPSPSPALTPTPAATSAAPTPTASATPTSTPPAATPAPTQAAGQTFETQNGTMRLQLPPGWTIRDESRLSTDFEGDPWWENSVAFVSPAGTELGYYDGFGDSAGFFHTDFRIVEERPMRVQGAAAMSWWVHDSDRWFVHAAVAQTPREEMEPVPLFGFPGVDRTHTFTMLLLGDDQPWVGSQAEAEQLLTSPAVLEALDVMATLELTGVDPSTLPPGVEP